MASIDVCSTEIYNDDSAYYIVKNDTITKEGATEEKSQIDNPLTGDSILVYYATTLLALLVIIILYKKGERTNK